MYSCVLASHVVVAFFCSRRGLSLSLALSRSLSLSLSLSLWCEYVLSQRNEGQMLHAEGPKEGNDTTSECATHAHQQFSSIDRRERKGCVCEYVSRTTQTLRFYYWSSRAVNRDFETSDLDVCFFNDNFGCNRNNL